MCLLFMDYIMWEASRALVPIKQVLHRAEIIKASGFALLPEAFSIVTIF